MENIEVVQLEQKDVWEAMDADGLKKFSPDEHFNSDAYTHHNSQVFVDLYQVQQLHRKASGATFQKEIIGWVGALLVTGTLFALNLGNPIFAGLFVLTIVLMITYGFFVGKVRLWRRGRLESLTDASVQYAPAVLNASFNSWIEQRYGLKPYDSVTFSPSGGSFTANDVTYVYRIADTSTGKWMIVVEGEDVEAPVKRAAVPVPAE